jgi:hypothetical protein
VYPYSKGIKTAQWDFRTPEFCGNFLAGPIDGDGVQEFICLGHSVTFHGDPTRNHTFWLTQGGGENLGKWDFNAQSANFVCSNNRQVEQNGY